MRRASLGRSILKLKREVMAHLVWQNGSSCGVIVTMVSAFSNWRAKYVMLLSVLSAHSGVLHFFVTKNNWISLILVNVVIGCSSCKVQESDTYDVLNICHGLDGKEEMEAIQGVLVIIFSTFKKGNGRWKKNNGPADTRSIGFVRKVFVFVLEEYEPKCRLIRTMMKLQCLEHLIHM